jgi:NAD+ synthase
MFSKSSLKLDLEKEATKITTAMQGALSRMRRRGVVLGLSGGIDSSVSCALAVRALGKERVLGLFMPEKDSSDDALTLGTELAKTYGIETRLENLGPTLKAIGCYERQVEAIRTVEPAFGEGWKFKLSLPSILENERLNITRLVVESPTGETKTHRLSAGAYSQIVAATNYKQRLRKVTEYYHADRLTYAVIGTPNRLEYDQGFFVKLGDGSADIKPIAHLYKSQVYQMAEHLGVPATIRSRMPTTDTFSLAQSQEEFYFSLPYDKMDLCLYALNHKVPVEEVAQATGLTVDQVGRVYKDIEAKRRTTAYLHLGPQLVEPVAEIH